MFGGHVPTVWLQEHLYDPDGIHWWDVVASWVYFSHFVAALGVAVVLWLRQPGAVGGVHAAVVRAVRARPDDLLRCTRPRRRGGRRITGCSPEVARISTRGWQAIGLHGAGNMLNAGQSRRTRWRRCRRCTRRSRCSWSCSSSAGSAGGGGRCCWPTRLAMTFTLVYTGEHYVIDVLVGWVYVGLAFGLCALGERWWRGRSAPRPARRRPERRRRRAERDAPSAERLGQLAGQSVGLRGVPVPADGVQAAGRVDVHVGQPQPALHRPLHHPHALHPGQLRDHEPLGQPAVPGGDHVVGVPERALAGAPAATTSRARAGTGRSGSASMSTPSSTRAMTARVVGQSATGSRTLPRTPCSRRAARRSRRRRAWRAPSPTAATAAAGSPSPPGPAAAARSGCGCRAGRAAAAGRWRRRRCGSSTGRRSGAAAASTTPNRAVTALAMPITLHDGGS